MAREIDVHVDVANGVFPTGGSWWDLNVINRIKEFRAWIGGYDEQSKVHVRKYVASKGYGSILDCGSGLCSEFYGYIADEYPIKYKGIDSCLALVNENRSKGIDVEHFPLEAIGLQDSSFDVVFCRHVLEHLPYYDQAIPEMVRLASKEVVVVFFLKTIDQNDQIDMGNDHGVVYHNRYNRACLESFVLGLDKVESILWEDVNQSEEILHVFVRQPS